MGMLSTALSGINAAQLGLVTTEHNIANANTVGYSRQRIQQSAQNPVFTGAGFMGQGTQVNTIERLYDQFLVNMVNRTQASTSELSKYYDNIALIDNVVADPNAGLSPAVQDFFRGVQQVAGDPSSLPARQALASSGQALAARFQSLESRFSEIAEAVDGQISSTVGEINSLANQVAELNQRILIAGGSDLQPANDLLDQRDELIVNLNKLIRVQVINDSTGAANVFVGTGQQLVVSTTVSPLAAQLSDYDPTRTVVGTNTSTGFVALQESVIAGGELGGLIRFRNESLDQARNGLGVVAASLALTFNAQHALGQDLVGQVAGDSGFAADFFTPPTPTVFSNRNNAVPAATVTASYVPPSVGTNGFYTDLTSSDYQLLANGAGNFTLKRLSDNKSWGPAALGSATAPFVNGTLNSILANPADPAFDPQGFTLSASAVPAPTASDLFLIQPTRDAPRNVNLNPAIATDPRLIAAATPIRGRSGSTNLGSALVTSTSVGPSYVAPTVAVPITLTFTPPTVPPAAGFPNGSLAGFPVGTRVTISNAGALNGTTTISALTDPVPFQTGASIAINDDAAVAGIPANALNLQIDGKPAGGDVFIIERNVQGVSDARNMFKLGQLQTQSTMGGQTATFQSSYAKMVSDIGSRAREISVTRDAQEKLLEQSITSRDAVSGVNLDEEAANLIRFQQAYQASAKSLDIAARLFDTIIALGR